MQGNSDALDHAFDADEADGNGGRQTGRQSPQDLALTQLPAGARGRLVGVDGGMGLRRRLMALGLVPQTPIQMVASLGGPVIILVRGVRLAIGREAARRIRVAVDP